MRQRALILLAMTIVLARIAAAQTVVNSTFIGGDFEHKYSNPANWSPAEVPNNSTSKVYDVIIAPTYVNLDIDATVENLTISGPQFFEVNNHSFTVSGTTTVGASGNLDVYGQTFLTGSLSNFDAASKTLSGGRYLVRSGNGFDGTFRLP